MSLSRAYRALRHQRPAARHRASRPASPSRQASACPSPSSFSSCGPWTWSLLLLGLRRRCGIERARLRGIGKLVAQSLRVIARGLAVAELHLDVAREQQRVRAGLAERLEALDERARLEVL